MIRTIPNLISLARLILVPVILNEIWDRRYGPALAWCFVAGASDALDGFLARRLNATSRVGAYLDPIADKLLLSGSYLVLGFDRVIPWWLTAIVFGRDAIILGFAAYAMLFTKIRDFRPSIWGKISTAVQILTILEILLARVSYWDRFPKWFENSLITLTIAATLWSAIHYAWTALRMLRSSQRAEV